MTVGDPRGVFYDNFDTEEEAANLTARARLMSAIVDRIRDQGWTHAEAAHHLGITEPRVSALIDGKLSEFSLDALVPLLGPVGLVITVRHREAVDI